MAFAVCRDCGKICEAEDWQAKFRMRCACGGELATRGKVEVRTPPTADYVGGPVSWWAYADAPSEYVELPEVQKVHNRYHAANPEWVAFVPMGASWGPLEAMAAAAGYELAVATIATGQVLVAFDQRKESDPTMTNPMIKIR